MVSVLEQKPQKGHLALRCGPGLHNIGLAPVRATDPHHMGNTQAHPSPGEKPSHSPNCLDRSIGHIAVKVTKIRASPCHCPTSPCHGQADSRHSANHKAMSSGTEVKTCAARVRGVMSLKLRHKVLHQHRTEASDGLIPRCAPPP